MTNVEDQGRVRFVTLTRMPQLNALCSELIEELLGIVGQAQDDATIGCLVVRGAGERAFCAGADLAEILDADGERATAFINRGHRLMSAIADSDVPVIAAVDGWALGGGMELALACHILMSSTRSRFGLPEAKIGCMPGFGGTQRIFGAVSRPFAMRMLLDGEPVSASEAYHHGLIAFAPSEPKTFEEDVRTVADRVASNSRAGQARILRAARSAARPDALELEAALAAAAISSVDGQEGIRAFSEKRAPRFNGGSADV
jgi:enoyl-CoA hydratase